MINTILITLFIFFISDIELWPDWESNRFKDDSFKIKVNKYNQSIIVTVDFCICDRNNVVFIVAIKRLGMCETVCE